MAVNLSPVGGVAAQFFTNTGAVLTGGKLYTYLAGTTTPATTYTSSQGNVPWSNPIVLDAAGRVSGSGEIWLTDGIIYKIVLKDSTDVLIATYDNITGINSNAVAYTNSQEIQTATSGQTVFNLTTMTYQPGTNSLSVFVDGVNQYGPGAQYAYTETDADTVTFVSGLHVGAEVKFTTTQQQGAGAVDASQVSYNPPFTGGVATNVEAKLSEYVSIIDFGAVGDGATDDTAAIAAAETACLASGQSLYFPAGTYKCLTGLTKKAVNWHGDGKYKSVLSFYGSGTFINATGTSPSRVICTISDMGFNGANANANAVGFTFGWNQRSTPLVRVHIANFGHYGIHFNDENWIVDFYDVEVDSCGKLTSNSSGVFKNGTVDAGTWNAISFYNLTVEGCGSASSAAGGIRLVTDNANRGLYFYSPCVEGNFGTTEIYISNMADCQFHNLYMEVVSAQATNAVELYGVTGGFTGGYVTGDNIVSNLVGVKIRAGGAFVSNQIEFDKITITNFASSIDSESAKIWTNQIHGNRTFADPSTSTQYFGDYSPRVSAVKNATQTVTSGSFQKVTFQTEVYDLCGKFASSTWTPQTIGTYQIDAGVRFTAGVDQTRLILGVYVRGSLVKSVAINCSGTGEQSITISAQVDTQLINDAIELYVRQDSGSDKTVSSGSTETWFMGNLIGRIA